VYLPAIDFVLCELATRSNDSNMSVIEHMTAFSAGRLLDYSADLCKPVKSTWFAINSKLMSMMLFVNRTALYLLSKPIIC
jgi:hypothetical protein